MSPQDYKNTLNLPKTAFPMKAKLPQREPEVLKRWEEDGLYQKIRASRKGRPKYILHDGPPYANGDVHVGTALNKVLKDIVVRYKTLTGWDAPFVPGWDCHGLPIEHQVMKELGPRAKTLKQIEIRKRCRQFAEKFIDVQRGQFKRRRRHTSGPADECVAGTARWCGAIARRPRAAAGNDPMPSQSSRFRHLPSSREFATEFAPGSM